MAWVTIDDQVPRHHKMIKAGPEACWLWVCGIAHAQSLLTDGFIGDEVLPMIGIPSAAKARRLAAILVEVGLFEREYGGYRVHDYHGHNATADEARAARARHAEVRAAAGRLGGVRSGIVRREATKQNAKQTAEANEAPSHPIPSTKKPPNPLPLSRKGAEAKPTRRELDEARQILKMRFGQCQHDPPCANHGQCVRAIVADVRARAVSA